MSVETASGTHSSCCLSAVLEAMASSFSAPLPQKLAKQHFFLVQVFQCLLSVLPLSPLSTSQPFVLKQLYSIDHFHQT